MEDKKMIGIIVAVVLIAALAIGALFMFVGRDDSSTPREAELSQNNNILEIEDNMAEENNSENPFEVLDSELINTKKSVITTEKGVIEIELFGEAPLAASNHIELASKGFYDGLTFHRREEGFVIQGGDPLGTGTGGPGYQFSDEPVSRSYDRGIVAMANAGPNTNGSQFFIMLADVPLPPNYTIFGFVTSGLDVVDQIQVGDIMQKVEILDK